ncbi:conserved hypothetical protein [Ricinus communis]|uniref:Uncharacterized protein n=1 Tax=Ricinus communis TaxID=3988 RepID=B9S3H7_RICCO|nr:conserved hypothetical protein [Ricinus communis]
MTAQLNHFLAFSPVFFEKSNPTQNPCFLLLKVRFFSSARLTHNPKISHSESTESLISLSGNRVSRTVRAEAQDVLFEYLHSTRSFSFTDADHISKNSPHFLQQLLFKIDNDKDVARSLENPQILSAKCEKNILQALEFLLYIRMRIEEIANIIYEHMELLCSCSLKRPNSVCKELNVTKDDLCQIIREDPMKFFNLVSKSKVKSSEQILSEDQSKKRDKVAFLLRLGYVENSDEMMRALKKFRGRGDQLQERYDCLVQAGLDCNVVSSLIRHAPMVLNQTKDVIEKKIDCLTRCLGYPLTSVVAFPTYLCYDIERINHRFRMYVWLKDRGAAKPMLSLSTILACSDARFEKYFVDIHPEGPAVWKSLQNMSLTS